jgi:drug/metabolite transporter (DMT)-like permease
MTILLANKKGRRGGSRGDSSVESTAAENRGKASPLFKATLLATAILLDTNPVAVKYAVGYVSPLPFATLRFVVAGLVLWVTLRFFDPKGKLRREDFWAMAGLGVVGVALNNIAFTFGVSMTSASNTALVVATAPCGGCSWALCSAWSVPS